MLKKKKFIILLIMVSALTMTSCVNIIEKVFFNKNGGGTYTMTLDMTEMGEMLASLGSDPEEQAEETLGSLDKDFDKKAKTMEAVNGVSNVRTDFDIKKFIFSLSFDFTNINALNQGLSAYYHTDQDGDIIEQYTFFTKNKNTITRTSTNKILDAITSGMSGDQSPDPSMDPSVILGDMYYELDLSFENDVKSISNENYVQGNGLTWGKESVRWRKYLFKDSDADKSIEVSIKTKN